MPRNDTIHRFQIQTANNVAENVDFNFFKNDFLTSSAFQTLVPPNLWLLLCLSQTLNIFNVLFSSSRNRLNTLSPYQKFVQIGNAHNLGSVLFGKLCSRDKRNYCIFVAPLGLGLVLR